MWAFSGGLKLAIMVAALLVYAVTLSAAGVLWMLREVFGRRRKPRTGPGGLKRAA